jgi:hypothetical protein
VPRICLNNTSEFCSCLRQWSTPSVVGWGTALQARRLRVLSATRSFRFFIDLILPASDPPGGGGNGDRCVGLTPWPPSRLIFWKTWESQPLGFLRTYLGLYRGSYSFAWYKTHCVVITASMQLVLFRKYARFLLWELFKTQKWSAGSTGSVVHTKASGSCRKHCALINNQKYQILSQNHFDELLPQRSFSSNNLPYSTYPLPAFYVHV